MAPAKEPVIIRYVGMFSGVEFRDPETEARYVCEHGATVVVPAKLAKRLLEQAENWQPAAAAPDKKKEAEA